MINKDVVKAAVEEWLSQNDYFLVDVDMTPDGRIVIEIDHADGVWIEDCAALSRFLQERLGEQLGGIIHSFRRYTHSAYCGILP